MNKLYKTVLLAALGLASVSAAEATTYTQGDLLIGFTVSSGNDLVYDLGQESSLFNGENWSLGSLLTGYNLNNVNWGVVGDASGSPRIAFTTTGGALPNPVANNTQWSSLNAAAGALIQFAGPASSATGVSVSSDSSQSFSWNQETINGTLTTEYVNAYENPNVVGTVSDTLWAVPVGPSATAAELGNFALDGTGMLTFTSVPEPATYALFSVAGLMLLSLRNQLRNKKA